MSKPLDDFINAVRMADSIETEKFLIKTEEAHIRAFIRDPNPDLRPRVVSKLIFLDMLGENPSWGQMEAITLMTHDMFSYKRIGYIGASILLDENAELSVLVTHTLLKDLQSNDPNIQALALTFIANVGSAEVCRAVAADVKKVITSRSIAVLKRAGMAIAQIVRKNSDLTETFKNSVQKLLNHSSHGVIISGMNLVITMIQNEPKLAKSWSQFHIPFTKILRNLTNSRGSREFNFGVFNDPYMLIKAMHALALLGISSDDLDSILQSIISSTETRRNTGRAVLYQAVDTIVAISQKPSLRGLASNQVGRLLSMNDPNVLYSALSSFARVLYSERTVINRGSADSMALQRYKSQIVKCLDHKDPSIRRRALDVISALIDEKNVETLIPEILAYVKLADAEFRTELVAKIYSASQRFAPTPEWNFDTILSMLVSSGNYISADIIASFCELISSSPKLQIHAVSKLSDVISSNADNQNLVQVAAFVLGEFAREDNGIIDSFKQIVIIPQTSVETKLYVIMALAKVAIRLGKRQEVIDILADLSTNNNLEVQQRSGEMIRLILQEKLSLSVLAPLTTGSEVVTEESINIVENEKPESEDSEVDDLLLLVMDDAGPSKPSPPISSNLIDDLLGPSTTTQSAPTTQYQQAPITQVQTQQPMAQAPPQVSQPPPQVKQLYATAEYVIFGQSQPNATDPRQIALRLLIYGSGRSQLSEFQIEYQPRPGWQLRTQPPDGKVLQPKGGAPIIQILYLFNQNNSPFALNLRVSYKFGSQPITENDVITVLP